MDAVGVLAPAAILARRDAALQGRYLLRTFQQPPLGGGVDADVRVGLPLGSTQILHRRTRAADGLLVTIFNFFPSQPPRKSQYKQRQKFSPVFEGHVLSFVVGILSFVA